MRARRGQTEGAIEDLEVAAQDPDVGPDAQLRLAAVLLADGRAEEAAPIVRKLLRVAPEEPAVRFVAAWGALLQGRHEAARRHAEFVLGALPEHKEARVVLALACEALGDRACLRRAGFEQLADGDGDAGGREQALAELRAALTRR